MIQQFCLNLFVIFLSLQKGNILKCSLTLTSTHNIKLPSFSSVSSVRLSIKWYWQFRCRTFLVTSVFLQISCEGERLWYRNKENRLTAAEFMLVEEGGIKFCQCMQNNEPYSIQTEAQVLEKITPYETCMTRCQQRKSLTLCSRVWDPESRGNKDLENGFLFSMLACQLQQSEFSMMTLDYQFNRDLLHTLLNFHDTQEYTKNRLNFNLL